MDACFHLQAQRLGVADDGFVSHTGQLLETGTKIQPRNGGGLPPHSIVVPRGISPASATATGFSLEAGGVALAETGTEPFPNCG